MKLKAWDNHEKRWAKTHEIEGELFINPEVGDTGVFYIHDHSASGKLHYTFIHPTGLHDRHGKEIWEGDRVTAHYFYFDGNFDADGYITGEIRITPNGILICSDTEDRFIYETSHHDEPCLEVIGNIFEGRE